MYQNRAQCDEKKNKINENWNVKWHDMYDYDVEDFHKEKKNQQAAKQFFDNYLWHTYTAQQMNNDSNMQTNSLNKEAVLRKCVISQHHI